MLIERPDAVAPPLVGEPLEPGVPEEDDTLSYRRSGLFCSDFEYLRVFEYQIDLSPVGLSCPRAVLWFGWKGYVPELR